MTKILQSCSNFSRFISPIRPFLSGLIIIWLAGALQVARGNSEGTATPEVSKVEASQPEPFGGIGLTLALKDGPIATGAIPGSPANRAGLMAGDRLLKINGDSVAGLSLKEIVTRVRGKVGTSVVLTVAREGEAPQDYTLVRSTITINVNIAKAESIESAQSVSKSPVDASGKTETPASEDPKVMRLEKALLDLINLDADPYKAQEIAEKACPIAKELGEMGPIAKPTLPTIFRLGQYLRNVHYHIPGAGDGYVLNAIEAKKNADSATVWDAFKRIGPPDESNIPGLKAALDDKNEVVRNWAKQELHGLGPTSDTAIWKAQGWNISESKKWVEKVGTLATAIEWKKAGFSLEDYDVWSRVGCKMIEVFGRSEVGCSTVDVLKRWHNAGYSPDEANKQIVNGVSDPGAKAKRQARQPYVDKMKHATKFKSYLAARKFFEDTVLFDDMTIYGHPMSTKGRVVVMVMKVSQIVDQATLFLETPRMLSREGIPGESMLPREPGARYTGTMRYYARINENFTGDRSFVDNQCYKAIGEVIGVKKYTDMKGFVRTVPAIYIYAIGKDGVELDCY